MSNQSFDKRGWKRMTYICEAEEIASEQSCTSTVRKIDLQYTLVANTCPSEHVRPMDCFKG